MFELGLSVTKVNMSRFNGGIPVAMKPGVMYDSITERKKGLLHDFWEIRDGKIFPWVTSKPRTDPSFTVSLE
jgi:hypothetical protein